jgi:hypothetical protein
MRGVASEFSRDILDVHGILQARVAPLEQELEKLQAENASLRAEIVRLHGERDEVAQITKQITLVTASMLDQHICLDATVKNAEADAPALGHPDTMQHWESAAAPPGTEWSRPANPYESGEDGPAEGMQMQASAGGPSVPVGVPLDLQQAAVVMQTRPRGRSIIEDAAEAVQSARRSSSHVELRDEQKQDTPEKAARNRPSPLVGILKGTHPLALRADRLRAAEAAGRSGQTLRISDPQSHHETTPRVHRPGPLLGSKSPVLERLRRVFDQN